MGENLQLSCFDCYKTISTKLGTKNLTVLECQQIPFDDRRGLLGEHSLLKITIEYNSSEETHVFFVKSLPQVASQRNFLEDFNGVVKEKKFFTTFVPLLKKHDINILDGVVPTCYCVSKESFIFEDLNGQGYDVLPCNRTFDIASVKAGLTSLAKLHASGLILEEKKSLQLTEIFGDEIKESFYVGSETTQRYIKACAGGILALIDLTHEDDTKISKDVFKEKAIEGCRLLQIFAQPSAKFRNTICHSDAHTKNFLFKFDEERVQSAIVDFQTYLYAPPAQDILSFIYWVTDRKLRQKHLDELLEFYYEELRDNLREYGFEDMVSREEFFESCEYYKQFVLIQTLTHFQVIILPDKLAGELFGNPEEAKAVMFGDKYDFMKTACEKDTDFRNRNFEAIADLREFYEKLTDN